MYDLNAKRSAHWLALQWESLRQELQRSLRARFEASCWIFDCLLCFLCPYSWAYVEALSSLYEEQVSLYISERLGDRHSQHMISILCNDPQEPFLLILVYKSSVLGLLRMVDCWHAEYYLSAYILSIKDRIACVWNIYIPEISVTCSIMVWLFDQLRSVWSWKRWNKTYVTLDNDGCMHDISTSHTTSTEIIPYRLFIVKSPNHANAWTCTCWSHPLLICICLIFNTNHVF